MDPPHASGDGGWAKTLRNFGVEAKRSAERATVNIMKKTGLAGGPPPGHDPDFDFLSDAYTSQSAAVRALRADATAAFEALSRASSTGHSLAVSLADALPANAGAAPRGAADALARAQVAVADDVLRKVERRVSRRILGPAEDELARAREVARRLEARKRLALDAARYAGRVDEGGGVAALEERAAAGSDDARKALEKLSELHACSRALRDAMSAALPRRARLIESCVAETIEFQRRFYMDASRAMERCVESVGVENLAGMRGGAEEADAPRAEAEERPAAGPTVVDDDFFQFAAGDGSPVASAGGAAHEARKVSSSIWDENDDDDDDADADPMGLGLGRASPPPAPPPRASSSYPSSGVGARESPYPPARSASRAARPPVPGNPPARKVQDPAPPGSAPMSRSSSREAGLRAASVASSSPPASQSGDLLGGLGEGTASVKKSRSRRTAAPAAAAAAAAASVTVDDLMDFGPSTSRTSLSSAGNGAAAMEGDLLGVFGDAPAKAPARSASKPNVNGGRRGMSASSSAASGFGLDAGLAGSSSASKPAGSRGSAGRSGGQASNLEREELKRQHDAEIKARADEKLAAVREREGAEAKERSQKDDARSAMQRRINAWTGNGTRRGNLRALIASLDTVLYPGATWKPVSMDTLKAAPKVKISYHKAILQVHPDKVGPKNLSPDHQVLAELIFDELQNGYEVFTAEQEGRPPPPGSVGPKSAMPSGGGGSGMNQGNNFYGGGMNRFNQMGRGGGRGGMNGGMGGMGRGMGGGMGNGMGGGMGRGMGPGRGMGAGYGGMYGAGGGMGMNNGPFGVGRGMNQQQRR